MQNKGLLTVFCIVFCYVSLQGQNYFQQEVNYEIDVKLDDENHVLHAFETFEYINNSPDQLDFLWIHLWPNAYSNGKTAMAKQKYRDGDRFMFYALNKDLGGIDSLDFKINGTKARWEFHPEHVDICKLYLSTPLQPGGSVEVSTPFRVKLPSGKISRLGHIDQSYQITQWYPKPAVYDQNGWHEMPYLTQGEFYSEFGTFDVKITLPKNYLLAATGNRIDAAEEEAWLDEKAKETAKIASFTSQNDTVNLGKPTVDMSFPPSSAEMKTIHFKQDRVHDFGWFADKRWHVLKGEATTPNTGKKVTTWAYFTNKEGGLWKNSLEYLEDAIHYYSLWNGDYPYDQVTAVDGTISAGGGMEYPTITVIGTSGNARSLEQVIVHEVGHNWFYGILGSNERTNAWMDEGLNTLNETRYFEAKYPDLKLGDLVPKKIAEFSGADKVPYTQLQQLGYLLSASTGKDQPMQCHSDDFRPINYGVVVYQKTGAMFDYLRHSLGDTLFDKCMKVYYEKWKFKHPQPADLETVFREHSGRNLDWFFQDMINTDAKLDYAISKIDQEDDAAELTIVNKTTIAGSYSISALNDDKIITTRWYPGHLSKKEIIFLNVPEGTTRFKIDAEEVIPEINRQNNSIKTKGLFKKIEPLEISPVFKLNSSDKTEAFYLPVLAWNDEDKWMPGLLLHNFSIPFKRTEYAVVGLYSPNQNRLNGIGKLTHRIFDLGAIDELKIGVSGKAFTANRHFPDVDALSSFAPVLSTRYSQWRPFIKASFGGEVADDKHKYTIELQQTFNRLVTERSESSATSSQQLISRLKKSWQDRTTRAIYNIRATLERVQTVSLTDAGDYKIYAEANWSYKYNRPGDKLSVRVFGGSELGQRTEAGPLRLSAPTGQEDYAYDNLYLGRSEGDNLLARQYYNQFGGMRYDFGLGYGDHNFMFTTNVDWEIPKCPLILFADWGMVNKRELLEPNQRRIITNPSFWDIGVGLSLFQGILEINAPVIVGENLNQQSYEIQEISLNNFTNGIRFQLNLNALNVFDILRSQI